MLSSYEYFIVREMFVTREWKLDLFSRYFFGFYISIILWKIWDNIWEAKLATKIFSHEHFIGSELFITTEWKWDLFSRYFFGSHRQNFFENCGQKFFLKVASKISHENFICCQVRIFYRERGVHYKRTEIRLTLEGLFWKRRVKNFLSRWIGIKMFPPNIIS